VGPDESALHGIEVPVNVRHDNTLARPYASYTSTDRVDVIITNPPFGGMEEDGTEKNFPTAYRTKVPRGRRRIGGSAKGAEHTSPAQRAG